MWRSRWGCTLTDKSQAVVVHIFDPSTGEVEAGGSPGSSLAQSTELVKGQPGYTKKPCFEKPTTTTHPKEKAPQVCHAWNDKRESNKIFSLFMRRKKKNKQTRRIQIMWSYS